MEEIEHGTTSILQIIWGQPRERYAKKVPGPNSKVCVEVRLQHIDKQFSDISGVSGNLTQF